MKNLLILLIFGLAYNQYLPTDEDIKQMSYTDKVLLYEAEKKDPFKAIRLNFVYPLGGYAYIDNVERGLLFTVSEGILFSLGVNKVINGAGGIKGDQDEDWDKIYAGTKMMGIGIGIKLFESIDLFIRTNKYNKKLSEKVFGEIQKFENKNPSLDDLLE